jgi:nicotinamidase-related amidase
MMTHMCIDTTVRAASDLGFACTVVGDATATKDLTHGNVTVPAAHVQAAYLAGLNGLFAKVI